MPNFIGVNEYFISWRYIISSLFKLIITGSIILTNNISPFFKIFNIEGLYTILGYHRIINDTFKI